MCRKEFETMDYFVKCVEYGENLEIDWKNHATYPQKNQASSNFFFFFYFFSTFGKSKLTTLTTNMMFSKQRFAILAMFLLRGCVICPQKKLFFFKVAWFVSKFFFIFFRGCMIFFLWKFCVFLYLTNVKIFFERLRDSFCGKFSLFFWSLF